MGSRDIMNFIVVGMQWNLQSIIAVLECTPPITTYNKAMPSFSYRVKVSGALQPVLMTACIERPSISCS